MAQTSLQTKHWPIVRSETNRKFIRGLIKWLRRITRQKIVIVKTGNDQKVQWKRFRSRRWITW